MLVHNKPTLCFRLETCWYGWPRLGTSVHLEVEHLNAKTYSYWPHLPKQPFTLHNTKNTVLCRDGKGQFPQQVGRWQAMAAATGCCSTCPLAGPEPDGRALLARLTSVRCARELPQEVGH